MREWSPCLDVLPEAQREVWAELSTLPPDFTLHGETALALHLGHRKSFDFEFFVTENLDFAALEEDISFLYGAEVTERDKNILTATVDRGGPVKVSFFGMPKLRHLNPPRIAEGNGLKVASLLDLAGNQASKLQVRAEAKDYVDMDALIRVGKVGLPFALAAAKKLYGKSFNPEITLKALSHFNDGNLRWLSNDVKFRLADAIEAVDLERLPNVKDFALRADRDRDKGLGL